MSEYQEKLAQLREVLQKALNHSRAKLFEEMRWHLHATGVLNRAPLVSGDEILPLHDDTPSSVR